jgi:hypothetical protein
MSTRAQLLSEISTDFADNSSGAITPAILRTQQNDLVNSAWITATDGTPLTSTPGSITSATLAAAVSDETGSGSLVFANAATLIGPILGTPASGNLANCTHTNAFIVQGTADANLTGAQFLGALSTGIIKNTTTTGVLSIASSAGATPDYLAPGSSPTLTGTWLFNAATPIQLASTSTSGLQIYNTADQVTNYERFSALWSGNVLQIGNLFGGTGSSRAIQIGVASSAGSAISRFLTIQNQSPYFNFTINTATAGITNTAIGGTLTSSSGVNLGLSLTFTYNQTSTAGSTDLKIVRTETGLGSGVANLIDTFAGTTGATNVWTLSNSGKSIRYAAVATAGWGQPAIYAAGRVTAQVAAAAAFSTYTVGAADGSFIVSANINVTAATTASFTCTCTYTDETNTSRTLTLNFSNVTGTLLTTITNVTGTGAYEGVPLHIRCKASTAITFATVGTFTSVTYNAEGIIQQVA